MAWEASTEFTGLEVRPEGFPGAINPTGGTNVPGWSPAAHAQGVSSSGFSKAWGRLPWEPSGQPQMETRIRTQDGWGFAVYMDTGDEFFDCSDRGRRYATRSVSGSAGRSVSSGPCAGQVDVVYNSSGFDQTYEWTFRDTPDDPETEEGEADYGVDIDPERNGTFTITVNDWEVSGASCNFTAGTAEDTNPPGADTFDSATTASFSYSTGGGYTGTGSLSYTLSNEVTTGTMADLLDDWLEGSDEFMAATATGERIHQTASEQADFGTVGRGAVRFSIHGNMPEGVTVVVDMVVRECTPLDRISGGQPEAMFNSGPGSLDLTDPIGTSRDNIGTWDTGGMNHALVDDAPWHVDTAIGGSVSVGSGEAGDCGFAVRLSSRNSRRRFRWRCRITEDGGDPTEVWMEMPEEGEPGLPRHTQTLYWDTYADGPVFSASFSQITTVGEGDPAPVQEWKGDEWVDFEEDISELAGIIVVESKRREGALWGFQGYMVGSEPGGQFATITVQKFWGMTGTNPDTCGDSIAGASDFDGTVEVDVKGVITEDVEQSAAFGGIDYDQDYETHPDARHPWYCAVGSYVLQRFPFLGGSAAEEDSFPIDPPVSGDYDQPVEVSRDDPRGWGDEVSRSVVELEPITDDEDPNYGWTEWHLPDSWPSAGQMITWENLRYIAAP